MFVAGPDAGEALYALTDNAEVGTAADQDFFQSTDELYSADAGLKGAQVKDGIADQLPRAVEGDVAAAVALEQPHALLRQQFSRGQQVLAPGVAAQGDDWGMFQQKHDISTPARLAHFHQRLLQAQAGSVVNGTELDDGDQNPFPRMNAD
jgi:hypothetical protein